MNYFLVNKMNISKLKTIFIKPYFVALSNVTFLSHDCKIISNFYFHDNSIYDNEMLLNLLN